MIWTNCARCQQPGIIHHNGQHYCSSACMERACAERRKAERDSRSRTVAARSRETRHTPYWIAVTLVIVASLVIAGWDVRDAQSGARIEAGWRTAR